MTTYIQNLVTNYVIPNKPHNIELVLDGGAFNGFYQLGALKLIKELEKINYIKVNRISGVSVGAMLGFYYLSDQLDEFENDFENIRDYFRENLNVGLYRTYLKNRIHDISDTILNTFQNKLFIAYYNVSNGQRTVKSQYTNKQELTECILKSSHLPLMSNGDVFYKEKNNYFVDGLYPYIFNDRDANAKSKILYITLTRFNNTNTLLSTKKEVNIIGRILEGAMDAHKLLFLNKETNFCSFVNDWTVMDYVLLRIKHITMSVFIYFIVVFGKTKSIFYEHIVIKVKCICNKDPIIQNYMNMLNNIIQPNILINLIKNMIKNLYKDLLLYYCI